MHESLWLSLQPPEGLADISSEPEVTLVIQLGYRGAAFCGFAHPAHRGR